MTNILTKTENKKTKLSENKIIGKHIITIVIQEKRISLVIKAAFKHFQKQVNKGNFSRL